MKDLTLPRHSGFSGVTGPLLLVILDGVGLYRGQSDGYPGNAFDLGSTPNIDRLLDQAPLVTRLAAHGRAVGMPSDSDMGNSEVGHNAMGAGRVFAQGARLVNEAIADGSMFEGVVWRGLVEHVRRSQGTFHLIGLLSDGNVHSHIDHLEALLSRLASEGVDRARVHALADGRDVDPVTFDRYIDRLEAYMQSLRAGGLDAAVASGGGRMKITMDRYNASWDMVRKGWETHVLAEGRRFRSASEAIRALRDETPGIIDQDLPPFVIAGDDGEPLGPIVDGDAVVLFNFRGDRAIEISQAFTERALTRFDRKRVPDVMFAGMMEYDGDLHLPPRYLVSPPAISHTVSEYLVANGISQLAISETQKYGHVTYFWNGNNSEKFDETLEQWIEIPSDDVPFDTAPAMKAREICDALVQALRSGRHRFLRVNLANGDMVGHTGNLEAAIKAIEVVDECVGVLERECQDLGATMIVTADHGNLDMMLEVDKRSGELKLDQEGKPVTKTSHTLSPVPWLLIGERSGELELNREVEEPGLANLAATIMLLLGFEPPRDYLPPLVLPGPEDPPRR